jgi:ribose transport system permease protein
VLTLAAYVSMAVMNEHDGALALGLASALLVGACAGALNFLAIIALRLPPIIATLAWSFVFQSAAFNLGGEATLKPPALLSEFATVRLLGVQVMPIAVMALTVVAAFTLARTVWGRRLLALGQSEPAARLVGISVGRVRLVAYIFSGVGAALTGFLLSGFTGGAALNMGDAYLMESIAVVVLGGASIAGGRANAVGIWGAALFFNLMGTMLNTFRIQAGARFMLMGALIIVIVAAAPRARVA